MINLASNEDDETDELDNFCFNYMVGSSFRYGIPFVYGSMAKSRDVLCEVNLNENWFREMVRVNWNTFDIILPKRTTYSTKFVKIISRLDTSRNCFMSIRMLWKRFFDRQNIKAFWCSRWTDYW